MNPQDIRNEFKEWVESDDIQLLVGESPVADWFLERCIPKSVLEKFRNLTTGEVIISRTDFDKLLTESK